MSSILVVFYYLEREVCGLVSLNGWDLKAYLVGLFGVVDNCAALV